VYYGAVFEIKKEIPDMPLRTFSLSFWLRQSFVRLATMLLMTSALQAYGQIDAAAGYSQIYSFLGNMGNSGYPIDGGQPVDRLIAYQGALYGTTPGYGADSCGTVFQLTPPAKHPWWTEIIYSFTGGTNDGCYPMAGLITYQGALYGTTSEGGSCGGYGTVFKITPPTKGQNAWTETVLYSFCGNTFSPDGAYPQASLIPYQGALYGTASEGGLYGGGTVFRLTPSWRYRSGWKEEVLYSFCSVESCGDGYHPLAELIEYNGELYTTTEYGGKYNFGTVFKLTPPAPGKKEWTPTVLHSFCASGGGYCLDGYYPVAGLIVDPKGDPNGILYGTTYKGGSGGYGTVFKITPPAQGQQDWTLSPLHTFSDTSGYPAGTLLEFNQGALYGTTEGAYYSFGLVGGTAFKLTPPAPGKDTWTHTVLHSFSDQGNDGWYPAAGMIVYQGLLYGTTRYGGDGTQQLCGNFVNMVGCGTVFAVTPN
jgi:uncharacterized repeat protein (TIGR03803 family)